MFKQFDLSPAILKNVDGLGYTEPTPVQYATIPPAMTGGDLIVTAETGSGKTAAFLLPMLQKLMSAPAKGIRGLVLCPTREIALQVQDQARLLGAGTGLRSLAIYGGVGITPQLDSLRRGLDLVVATPGRLLDHQGRGSLNLGNLEFLILDEADRMLDMGFLPDLKRILALLPVKRQTMLFSATMPLEVTSLAERFMLQPRRVIVGRPATPPEAIAQRIYPVAYERKTDMLLHLLQNTETDGVLVFTRTKHRADRLAKQLSRTRINAACLHGDRSQSQREAALNGFRRGAIKVLVATDIAARGLDIRAVTHVINYDLPTTPDDYIHRIGRTARAGGPGNAWSMITFEDTFLLRGIEKALGHRLSQEILPGFELAVGSVIVDEKQMAQRAEFVRRQSRIGRPMHARLGHAAR